MCFHVESVCFRCVAESSVDPSAGRAFCRGKAAIFRGVPSDRLKRPTEPDKVADPCDPNTRVELESSLSYTVSSRLALATA